MQNVGKGVNVSEDCDEEGNFSLSLIILITNQRRSDSFEACGVYLNLSWR